MPNRREFLQTLGTVAAPALPLALAASEASAQPPENAMGVSEVARHLTEAVRARYGKRIEEASYKTIQQRITANLTTAETLKRLQLINSDEPDFVFFAAIPE
jgi:hypothetical protein